MKIRKPAVSGMFYPKDKEELTKMLNTFFNKVPSFNIKNIKSLIAPHAGYIYSGLVAAYSYSLLKNYKNKELKIILLGPSHTTYFNNIVSDTNDYWETPLGKVKAIKDNFQQLESAHSKEHCLEVQLPFLQLTLNNFEILPLVAGNLDPKEVLDHLNKVIDNKTLLIISSDLSHYYDYDKAVKTDNNSISAILDLDYDNFKEEGNACGKIPILILIEIAKKRKWKTKLLIYKNSGDVTKDKSSVVGYASIAFY